MSVWCIKDWCKWPNEELEEMESTLAVQQVSWTIRIILGGLKGFNEAFLVTVYSAADA